MASVTTTPVALFVGPLLIQNLGPDDLYVGQSDMNENPLVTSSNGFRLSTGESVSIGTITSKISVVSTGTSEVRYLSSGTGVYAAVAPTA